MTELLEKAIAELNRLPDEQQNTMAQWILEELEDDRRWDAAFANSLPQDDTLPCHSHQRRQSACQT